MSGFLLDTHVWFWALDDEQRLPRGVRSTLSRRAAECRLSPVSVWEIAILGRKKRLTLKPDVTTWIGDAFKRFPIGEASLTFDVTQRAAELLTITDPADALIAATAMTHDLTLLTLDRRLQGLKGLRTLSR